MSFKRVRVILLTGMVLIVLVITAGLILTYGTKKTTYAPLPQASASVSAGPAITSSGATNNNGLNSVSVTTGNVQAVIATLSQAGQLYPEHPRRKLLRHHERRLQNYGDRQRERHGDENR